MCLVFTMYVIESLHPFYAPFPPFLTPSQFTRQAKIWNGNSTKASFPEKKNLWTIPEQIYGRKKDKQYTLILQFVLYFYNLLLRSNSKGG